MFTVYLTGLWYVLDGRFLLCTVWALSMYWVDVSHETTPWLVRWIPDIADQSTLRLKPFILPLNLQYLKLFTGSYKT